MELQLLMKPKDVASSQEFVDEHAKQINKQLSQPRATIPGVVHTCVGQKEIPINLIVLQNQSLKIKKIRTKSTNDLTKTVTMVMEPLAPLAAIHTA
jgi:hypothetical protein